MRQIAEWIVRKNRLILGIMLLLCVLMGLLSFKVEINEDMTKYLPDDSNMRAGLALMDTQFPELDTSQTIRVMADGLSQSEEHILLARLAAIPNVDSVLHDEGEVYHQGEHVLFILCTDKAYGSKEERSIEQALDDGIDGYELTWKNDDTSIPEMPMSIILTAVALLMVILFFMCSSWLEPFLFLVTIGVAVLLNNGSNLILGSVSKITSSIAAILQLVLSMDYSVILMNRYRQEKPQHATKEKAMASALSNAFSSITGSAITTVVGLLALTFMSFKIGMDLGLVLAKGVFISMLCIFTVLPGLILLFDRQIQRTEKPVLRIPTDGLARFSYRFRFPLTALFAVLFICFAILQGRTGIAYTLASEDPIAEIFPTENQIVLLYRNEDEDAIRSIGTELETDPSVRQVLSYPTLLGNPYTAQELSGAMDRLQADFGMASNHTAAMQPDFLRLIYYYHYDGSVLPLSMGTLLNFIQTDVLWNEAFSEYLSSDMRANASMLQNFSDPAALTAPRSAADLAAFLGMDSETMQGLMLLYSMSDPATADRRMTLSQFTDFLLDDVAANPAYSSRFDEETLAKTEQLRRFTDADSVTTPMDAGAMAALLGIDETQVRLLYTYYYQKNGGSGSALTVDAFQQLLQGIGAPQAEELGSLLRAVQSASPLSYDALSALTGISSDITQQIVSSAAGSASALLPVTDFVRKGAALWPENAALEHLVQLVDTIEQDLALPYDSMQALLNLDSGLVNMLYATYDTKTGSEAAAELSPLEAISFILDNSAFRFLLDADRLSQLSLLQGIMQGAVDGTAYSSSELASLFDMDPESVQQLFMLYQSQHTENGGVQISVQQLLKFLRTEVLPNPAYSGMIDAAAAEKLQMAGTLTDAVVSGQLYTPEQAAQLLGSLAGGMDVSTMRLLYLYYASKVNSDPAWTLTIDELFHYYSETLLDDPLFANLIDADTREELLQTGDTLRESIEMLKSEQYGRMILYTTLPYESKETSAFLASLTERCSALRGDHYLIGNSAMNYEMEQIFDKELTRITMLTAAAIFLVVAITFRALLIPLLLVLLVQCGVYITVTIVGLQGYSIYYLALLIVECILMGATIDYGILFTNYYREHREDMGKPEALAAAYRGTMPTIFTSGTIIVLVVGIVGRMFEEPTISQICKTISLGAVCAIGLIVFILPGMEAALDRLILGRRKKARTNT